MTDSHDLRCERREDDTGTWSILVSGELDMATAPRVAEMLDDTIDAGAHVIVVRMDKVTFIDSAGLGVLLKGANRLEAGGGQLFLDGAIPVVERMLKVSGVWERLRRRGDDEP